MLRRYVHGPGTDEPLTWYEGSGTSDRRYLITDNQGTVIAEDGSSVTRYTYGPYGEPNAWTGSRFRYTGQIALPEVALYHYKARVYDPVLGRFLQTDPVGYGGDLNVYAYVTGDPLNRTDSDGKCAPWCIGIAIGVAIEVGAQAFDPNARAAWQSAYNSATHGQWSSAFQTAAPYLGRIAISGAAGAVGGFGSQAVGRGAQVLARLAPVGLRVATGATANVVGNAALGAGIGAGQQLTRNALTGDHGSVTASTVGGAFGGALGSGVGQVVGLSPGTAAGQTGMQALANATGRGIVNSTGQVATDVGDNGVERMANVSGAVIGAVGGATTGAALSGSCTGPQCH